MAEIVLPAGTMTADVINYCTQAALIPCNVAANSVTMPDGSPATLMEPGLVAVLLRHNAITNAGWPGRYSWSPQAMAQGSIAHNERAIETLLGTGWMQADVQALLKQTTAYIKAQPGWSKPALNARKKVWTTTVYGWRFVTPAPGGHGP